MSTFDHESEFQSPAMNELAREFGTPRPGAEPLPAGSGDTGWKPTPVTGPPEAMPKFCTFCATDKYLILVASPDRAHGICEDCVAICHEILIEQAAAQHAALLQAVTELRIARDVLRNIGKAPAAVVE